MIYRLLSLLLVGAGIGLISMFSTMPRVDAFPGGAPAGRSKVGCGQCHTPYSGTTISTTQLSTPLTVTALSTILITASISGTTDAPGVSPIGGGLEVSASRGILTPGSGTRTVLNGSTNQQEITHTGRDSTEWSFLWTAPAANGPVDIWSALLLNNGDGKSSFDNWTVISRTITVVDGTWPVFLPEISVAHEPAAQP